jgi:hypothetical protein
MAATPDDQHHDEHTGVAGNLPTPVAAALGIVVSGVRTAKNLPTIAPQLPLIGMAFVAQKAQTVRREYLGYAARGIAFVQKMTGDAVGLGTQLTGLTGGLRGESANGSVAEAARGAERTVEEEAREVAEKARDAVEKATQLRRTTSRSSDRPAGRKDAAAKPTGKRTTTRPAGGNRPSAPAPAEELSEQAIEAGAPGAATAVAEQASQEAGANVPSTAAEGADLSPDDLAIPDIDHLTLASLRARLRQLDVPQLVTLRAYELAHANRLQVVTMLENRIAKLEADGPHAPATDSSSNSTGPTAAAPSANDGQQAAQQAAEPAIRRAESGADDLGATPRP